MTDYTEQFEQQRLARREGHFDVADAILDQVHKQAHDDAPVHIRVHLQWVSLRLKQHRYPSVAKELVAAVFAAPASWVQKYLGLVRPNV